MKVQAQIRCLTHLLLFLDATHPLDSLLVTQASILKDSKHKNSKVKVEGLELTLIKYKKMSH